MAKTLGCGVYDAYVIPRGGGEVFAVAEWTTLSWSRVIDDTSDAAILIDADCIGSIKGSRPWRHEIALYRDGKLVWVGPLVNPSAPFASDHLQYAATARGITAWWDHRLIHNDIIFDDSTDIATIFQAVSDDAMNVDNSPGLSLSTTPSGVLGTLEVLASQHVIAGTQLRDLAGIGIDFTEIGRTVLAGGKVVPTDSVGVFRDDHFLVPPQPQLDGLQQANGWVVRGSGGGVAGDSIYGSASDPAAGILDGILESVDTVSTIQDNLSAQAAAQTRTALTSEIISVDNAYLSPDAPFAVETLVPGALCILDLQETHIPVQGEFRIQKVTGQASSDGQLEQVQVTFQPVGSTA